MGQPDGCPGRNFPAGILIIRERSSFPLFINNLKEVRYEKACYSNNTGYRINGIHGS